MHCMLSMRLGGIHSNIKGSGQAKQMTTRSTYNINGTYAHIIIYYNLNGCNNIKTLTMTGLTPKDLMSPSAVPFDKGGTGDGATEGSRVHLMGHDIRNTQYYRGTSVSPGCGVLYYLQKLVSNLYDVDYFSQPALPTADDDLGEISNKDAKSAVRSILESTADLTSTVPLHHPNLVHTKLHPFCPIIYIHKH